MKKIVLFFSFVVAVALCCVSCSDDKMCRCVYNDGRQAHYFEADESENCSDASTSDVICSEE